MSQANDAPPTQEELQRIANCMEKPEFRKLLNEYMEAMQSPEAKKEEEEYLKQLEREAAEGNYQLQILLPEPAFCVKCRTKARDKVYINICLSEKIEIFREDYTGTSRNSMWNVPLSIGKPRAEIDKHGKSIETYDAVFHPKTVQLANDSRKFMCFLVEICVEHINEGYEKSLVPEFTRLGKVKSKGKPTAQSIRIKTDDPNAPAVAMPNLTPGATLSTINMLPSRTPQPKSSPLHPPIPEESPKPKPKPKPKPTESKAKPQGTTQPAVPPAQWVLPEYSLVHRGDISLGDAWCEREDTRRRLPKEIILYVQLPLMSSANEADFLEITDRRVYLKCEKHKYYLDLDLPFAVDEEKCKAKFDKAKHQLVVTMAVNPSPPPEVQKVLEEKAKEKEDFTKMARSQAEEEEKEREAERQCQEEEKKKALEEKLQREDKQREEEEQRKKALEELERRMEEQRQRKLLEEREMKMKALAEKTRKEKEAQDQAAKVAQEQREKALQKRLKEEKEAEDLERLLQAKEAEICLRNPLIFAID